MCDQFEVFFFIKTLLLLIGYRKIAGIRCYKKVYACVKYKDVSVLIIRKADTIPQIALVYGFGFI